MSASAPSLEGPSAPVHATLGSAPNANRSAARLSRRANGAGADAAVADAAVDTAIPERRHAANTSRLDAVASGSSAGGAAAGRPGPTMPTRARSRGRESPPTTNAAAKSNAAQV